MNIKKNKAKVVSLIIISLLLIPSLAIYIGKPIVSASSSTDVSNNLAYWRFDEGNGTILYDSSDNHYSGTLVNGPLWTDGKYGKALQFDGLNDHVNVPTLFSSSPFSLTISAWINSSLDKSGYIIYHGDNGEFVLHIGERPPAPWESWKNITSDVVGFSIKLTDGNHYDVYSTQITPNNWHHVVGIWEKGVSLRVYVDGILLGENNAIPNLNLYDPGSSYLPSIGDYNRGSHIPETSFKGILDEIMVFNKALNFEELTLLYSSGLVGYWQFNEGSGLIAHDNSGYGNDGTLKDSPFWTDGKFGKALLLDGSDYIQVPDSPTLKPQSFTISTWIYMTERPYLHNPIRNVIMVSTIHAFAGDFGSTFGYHLSFMHASATDDNLCLNIGTGDTQRWLVHYNSINDLTLSQWHQVVGTYDGAYAKIYIDGQLKATSNY